MKAAVKLDTLSLTPIGGTTLRPAGLGSDGQGVGRPNLNSRGAEPVALGELAQSVAFPPGRLPDLERIRTVLTEAGGAQGLVYIECAELLAGLTPDERSLALLMASVATYGVEEPIVVRTTSTGLEIVDGHRRCAAASLVDLEMVPARNLGPITDDEAAAYAGRSNQHRQALNAWQSVRLAQCIWRGQAMAPARELSIVEKLRNVGAPRRRDSAAHVARVLGIGDSTAQDYLRIAKAMTDEVLAGIDPLPARAHAALATLSFRKLRALAQIEPEADRIAAIRHATRLKSTGSSMKKGPTLKVRAGRDGALSLHVSRTNLLSLEESRRLLEILLDQERMVRSHLATLTEGAGGDMCSEAAVAE